MQSRSDRVFDTLQFYRCTVNSSNKDKLIYYLKVNFYTAQKLNKKLTNIKLIHKSLWVIKM